MVAYVQPRQAPPITSWLVAIILVTSIVATLGDGEVYVRLALVPRGVWRGELWRLVTWALVEPGPMALIFTCVAIHWLGGSLRSTWGAGRFSRFLAAVVLAGGVGTSLIALVLPMAWWYPHLGGLAVAKALVIAWALRFPERQVIVYWVVVVGGPPLAYGTLAVTVLFTLFYGVAPMLPELIACVVALLYMKAHRRWWLRVKAYRVRRKLEVLRGDRHGGPHRPS